jgi:MYXO-CTERM domain-containing protein
MFRDYVEFTFDLPAAWFPANPLALVVENVWFQFGSGFNEPGFWFDAPPGGSPPPPIPLPTAAAMAGMGLFALMRRRSRAAL